MRIVIDSREQAKLKFRDVETVVRKLDVGDYSFESDDGVSYERLIAIERKSPLDAFQTLTRGNERFQRELKRASGLEYFAVLIECSYRDFRDKKFPKSYMTKMRGDIILKILYSLSFKYNFHIIFCQDRGEASSILRKIFSSYDNYKNHSLHPLISDQNWRRIVHRLRRRLRPK